MDAALFEDVNCIGLGSVVRDVDGKLLMAKSSRYEGLLPPREAEALGLKEALSWMKGRNYRKCVFEMDSKILADACKKAHGNSYFHTIVIDCIDLFKHFEEVLVVFIHRSANDAAHLLAKAAMILFPTSFNM